LKKAFGLLIATLLFASSLIASGAHAQTLNPSILSPSDIQAYRAIFAAQENGELAKADVLIATLSDRTLLGYVQHQRYMGRHYITKFQELATWLSEYSDHFEANRIYNLALRKKNQGTRNPRAPTRARWRGERFEEEARDVAAIESNRGSQIMRQLRNFAGNDNPARAENAVKQLSASSNLPQGDLDLLYSYVASAYLADAHDIDARRVAESELLSGSSASVQLHWTAGLAAYRMGEFSSAAQHFEEMNRQGAETARDSATGAFWAARSHMRAQKPDPVLALYENAADNNFTFYGTLAARVIGRESDISFEEPKLDEYSYSRLTKNAAIRRAIAFWQVGRSEAVETELGRAFGEINSSLDPAFAALARMLGAPGLELRAAETAAKRGIYLTSLYPVPPYEPQGGYQLDQAIVLAVARQESRFNPEAESHAGARGLMQIMPATAAYITKDPSLARGNRDRLNDPSYSMRLGEDYLIDLLGRQNGSLFGLTAAYNAGLGNLSRWVERQEGNNDPVLFIESLPAAETRDYVKRVMVNMWMYQQRFGNPALGMDEAASGSWPTYKLFEEVAAVKW
jgi:soluble lytic murein transglycosylase